MKKMRVTYSSRGRIIHEPLDVFFGIRLSRSDLVKLAQLAAQTQRSKSAVLRQLLRQAALSGQSDIVLRKNRDENETVASG